MKWKNLWARCDCDDGGAHPFYFSLSLMEYPLERETKLTVFTFFNL